MPYFTAITNLQRVNKANRSEVKKLKFQLKKTRALIQVETRILTTFFTRWRAGVAYREIMRGRFYRILSETSSASKRSIFTAWAKHIQIKKAERQNRAEHNLVEEEMDILRADLLTATKREKEYQYANAFCCCCFFVYLCDVGHKLMPSLPLRPCHTTSAYPQGTVGTSGNRKPAAAR